MRLTKFFSLIFGYDSMVAICFRQLQIVNPRIENKQLILSGIFFGIIMTAGLNYAMEGIYYLITKHIIKSTRSECLYGFIFLINIALESFLGIYTNGFTD